MEPPQRVLIPDSSLEFMGHCGEQICIVFPKAPEKDVKELMDSYPKGFEGVSLFLKFYSLYLLHIEFSNFFECFLPVVQS